MKHGMLYPRLTEKGELIDEGQMVQCREHLSRARRIVFLTGVITDETESCNLLMALASLNENPIKMIVTSPGGLLDTTYMFCDTMKLVGVPIVTLARYCMSAAVLPFITGSPRYVLPNAKIMLHLPSAQLTGDARELDIQKEQFNKDKEKLVAYLQEHGVKKSRQQILKDIDREHWMGAEEAIKYGLADEIMTPEIMKSWLRG